MRDTYTATATTIKWEPPDKVRLRDNTALANRPEWLGPRDLQEVFGIGRTKAFTICQALPHIYVGQSIGVNKKRRPWQRRSSRKDGCRRQGADTCDGPPLSLSG